MKGKLRKGLGMSEPMARLSLVSFVFVCLGLLIQGYINGNPSILVTILVSSSPGSFLGRAPLFPNQK